MQEAFHLRELISAFSFSWSASYDFLIVSILVVAIPALNTDGFLPLGIHPCDSFDELRTVFGKTPHRESLVNGLSDYIAWIRPFQCFRYLYIDGSFVTAKSDPNDIDVVVELPEPSKLTAVAGHLAQVFDQKFVKQVYKIDILAVPFSSVGAGVEFFQHPRTEELLKLKLAKGYKKGILRLAL